MTEEGSLRPLSSVQVFIEGTGIGTFTNASGEFVLLNVPAGEQTLTVRLVGYRQASETVTVAAGETRTVDFALIVTAVQMDEIVVTGTGVATEKRRLGHTIATLDAAELENAPIADFSQLIAGREPGVVALPSSGYTGEGARIRIRGSASLSQLNEPIIYVDGIRVDRSAVQNFNGQGNPSRLDDIPPESIERVEILKGAAAATLYGTEASNGVIQIFTKRGNIGTPRFTLRADLTGISVPTNRILPVADFAGRACASPGCTGDGDAQRLADAVNLMSNRWGESVSPWTPVERDLIPDLLTTGFGQTYSGSLQGGTSVFQYFASGRLATEDGPYDASRNFDPVEGIDPENDTNRRASIHTNFTLIPSSDLRIGVTTLYSDMEHHTPDNSNNIYGVFSSALMSQLRLANNDPELGQINQYGQPAFATLRENAYQLNFVNSQHFAGATNINFTPTENFRLDGTFGIDFTSDDAVSFRPYRWNVDGFSGSTPDGSRNVNEDRSREITADVKGSYIFSTDRIENTFLFGGQGFLRQRQSAGGSGRDFPG
ncbi:MAG: TonB-dependent receptor plug domain-containing protein, partial [Gemmatimonadales bacterium]|nr:TonB-dependent receptor plug domain-containing protein [Gemmatimonadales bacterium]